MMDRETINATLGGGQAVQHLLEGWETSQASLRSEGHVFFLDPSYVAEAGAEAALEPGFVAALVDAACQVAANPAARALAWHAHHRLKERPRWGPEGPGGWPLPTAFVGAGAPLFYILALLGELPALRAIHEAHGVPQAVHQATLRDFQRWADHYRRVHGTWGIATSHLPWYWLHMHGELYELGRLQYEPGAWEHPVRAYRHSETGAVVALSEDNVRYRADGWRAGDRDGDAPGLWTARLTDDDTWAEGHRIVPLGYAERGVTRLDRRTWQQVLAPGDPVLSLHIPQGAPLDAEACRRSLDEARAFFPAHFPERPFRAFACHSWLLDPQFDGLLPATSNIVRFLRQMYLVPVADDGGGAFFFSFDVVPADLRQAPRDTTLRRLLIDHVLDGGWWRGGACFLLPDDLPAWGTDIYRTAPHAVAAPATGEQPS